MKSIMPLYERAFDLNDYVLLALIVIGFGLVYKLPKRFPRTVTLLLLLFCSTVASLPDNSLGGFSIDLYDIMDGPTYSIMDFIVYFFYPPYGYLFVYFYDRLQVKGFWNVLYITGCSLAAIALEWVCVKVGIFQYKNGYFINYSFCIYLATQSMTLFFYRYITYKLGETK
ncbi:MAG: hypothetical protein WCC10_02980 [Tumebacillaceae bacterium]